MYDDHLHLYNITLHMKYPKRNHVKNLMKSISVFLSHINNLANLIHFAL